MKKEYIEIDNKFYQECNIIMLPTKEKTNIVKQLDVKTNHLQFVSNSWVSTYNWEYQQLYFISDEEIKKGDWVYTKLFGVSKVKNLLWSKQENAKKIIATTDRELTIGINQCDGCQAGLPLKDGIHKDHQIMGIACTKERYVKQLPRPSNEFLKKFCELAGIDKVLVEMVDFNCPKCHGSGEYTKSRGNHSSIYQLGKCYCDKDLKILKVASDNTITCKPIQGDTYLFCAYKSNNHYEVNEPYFAKIFTDHTEMKVYSANHGSKGKEKYPDYVSMYWKVETDLK